MELKIMNLELRNKGQSWMISFGAQKKGRKPFFPGVSTPGYFI